MSPSSGESRRWFYVREGRRHGPIETTKLVDLVLGGEVPEEALVWHSGLAEWLPARDVEDIRRELPPPVPTQRVPPPPDPVPKEAPEGPEPPAPDESAAPEEDSAPTGPGEPEDLANGERRRRKRKKRRHDSKRRPAWLWPLAVVLVGLMIFLWWLLRRMNEVPPGRIIQTGSLQEGPRPLPRADASGDAGVSAWRWDASPGSAPASRAARPA